MAEAARIADDALAKVRPRLAEGPTEREIALDLDFEMRRLGAAGSSFETIVASGPNGAKPHHRPSDRRIGPGELVVIDFGAIVDGYCSDMTRTLCVGEPATATAARMVEVVAESQQAGRRRGPGRRGGQGRRRGLPGRSSPRPAGPTPSSTAPATASASTSTRCPGCRPCPPTPWARARSSPSSPASTCPSTAASASRTPSSSPRKAAPCSPTPPRPSWWPDDAQRLHQRPEERHGPPAARGPVHRGRVPARQAGQGRRLRAHQAQERAHRRRPRPHLPGRREARADHHRQAGDAVPLPRGHAPRVHGQLHVRPDPRRRGRDGGVVQVPQGGRLGHPPGGQRGRDRGRRPAGRGRAAGGGDRARACRATGCRAPASRPPWRRAWWCRCPCSSTPATASRSTPAPATTSPGSRRRSHGAGPRRQPAPGEGAGPVPAVRGRDQGRDAGRGRGRPAGGAGAVRVRAGARRRRAPGRGRRVDRALRPGLGPRAHARPRPGPAAPGGVRAGLTGPTSPPAPSSRRRSSWPSATPPTTPAAS